MTQTLLDPRMFDTSQALGAHDGSSLTGISSPLEFVTTTTATSGTYLIVSGLTEGDNYLIIGTDLEPVDTNSYLYMQGSNDGTTYETGSQYSGSNTVLGRDGTATNYGSGSTTQVRIMGTGSLVENSNDEASHFNMTFCRNANLKNASLSFNGYQRGVGSLFQTWTAGAVDLGGSAADASALRFYWSTAGGWQNGTVSVWKYVAA